MGYEPIVQLCVCEATYARASDKQAMLAKFAKRIPPVEGENVSQAWRACYLAIVCDRQEKRLNSQYLDKSPFHSDQNFYEVAFEF